MGHYGNYPNPELCNKYGCHKQRGGFMSCTGCLLSEKERQELLNKVVQDAKQQAIKDQKFMVIYDLPDGKVAFMEAGKARDAGITAKQFVSHLQ